VIIVYGATAFVILELVDIVSPSLGLPTWTLNFIIVLLCVGFFITVILSWVYDITPKGIIKTKPIEPAQKQKEDYPQLDIISRFKNSIAVLPFQDMSPQKDQEYFCDGMTEEIINALTHIESLKVIARTSAFAFKDKHKDIREIGKKLDVETVLEGSIRKDGHRLRITAQLVKVADGSHIWSDAYNRELEDVFAIQEEISLAIADTMKVKLLGKEKAKLVKRYTENLETYNLLLTGRFFHNKGSEEGEKKAIEIFEKIIGKVPGSAQAYAGLASCYSGLGFRDYHTPKMAFPKAKEAALKAIELDETLSEAHVALGLIKTMFDWDWEGAEREFKQAIELNPNYAAAYSGYAYYFTALGRLDEAIAECRRAVELDPLSVVIKDPMSIALLRAGRLEQAKEHLKKILNMEPNYSHAWWLLGQTYILESRYEEGISEIEKALDLSKNNALILSGLGWAYAISNRKSDAREIVDELKRRTINEYIRPYLFAKIYASLGEIDRAFEWLEKAYEEHDVSLSFMLSDETLVMLHSDQRYNRLVKKINLEKWKGQYYGNKKGTLYQWVIGFGTYRQGPGNSQGIAKANT
jgi:TolB-like protein/Flp pilus assembly protein TadD